MSCCAIPALWVPSSPCLVRNRQNASKVIGHTWSHTHSNAMHPCRIHFPGKPSSLWTLKKQVAMLRTVIWRGPCGKSSNSQLRATWKWMLLAAAGAWKLPITETQMGIQSLPMPWLYFSRGPMSFLDSGYGMVCMHCLKLPSLCKHCPTAIDN